MRVLLGNSAAKEAVPDGKGGFKHRDLDGNRVTTVQIPDSYSLLEQVQVVIAQDGVWSNHSRGANVEDSVPDWVEADDPFLAELIARQLGCKVGRPKSWKETTDAG